MVWAIIEVGAGHSVTALYELRMTGQGRDTLTAGWQKVFADDLKHSVRIRYRQWDRRGPFDRLLEILSLPIRREL